MADAALHAAADLWALGHGRHLRDPVCLHRSARSRTDRAGLGRHDHPALHRLRAGLPLAAGALLPGSRGDRPCAALCRAAAPAAWRRHAGDVAVDRCAAAQRPGFRVHAIAGRGVPALAAAQLPRLARCGLARQGRRHVRQGIDAACGQVQRRPEDPVLADRAGRPRHDHDRRGTVGSLSHGLVSKTFALAGLGGFRAADRCRQPDAGAGGILRAGFGTARWRSAWSAW